MSLSLKVLLAWLFSTTLTLAHESNHIPNSSGRAIETSEELISSVVLECFDGDESFNRCVRLKVVEYLGNVSGEKRSLDLYGSDQKLDNMIFDRVQRFIQTHQFTLQLPEFFFQKAALIFKPSRSISDFEVKFPENPVGEDRALTSARDMMKQKMLLPLLMIIKLKLKVLIPILLTIVFVKATKALILSKISLLVVLGFVAFQLFMKKNAMNMMATPMEPIPATPMPYGPPSPTPISSYGPPSTSSSYEAPVYDAPSSWEPAAPSGGPYARVGWDAQSLAYNGYVNQQSSNQPAKNKL
ncbi:DUF1676 domain-containing protein Osi20 [Lycorma delicatula]|uniref:DUF1676 domain-containing protein Osi20 n=1 Tax=Lycorma delicatula TaxID=130591 RepID=UPI003F517F1F